MNAEQYFFVTWVTHNSRISERMVHFNVCRAKRSVWLDSADELLITRFIAETVRKSRYQVLAYNICGDHVHLVVRCRSKQELSHIVQKLKSISARQFNIATGLTIPATRGHDPLLGMRLPYKGKTQNHLWAQKYHAKPLETEAQLHRAIHYTQHNREKHELPPLPQLAALIHTFVLSPEPWSLR